MQDKIVVKKRKTDHHDYVISVLEHARFALIYKQRLGATRSVPMNEQEEIYFDEMMRHIDNAIVVTDSLRKKQLTLWERIKARIWKR